MLHASMIEPAHTGLVAPAGSTKTRHGRGSEMTSVYDFLWIMALD